MARLATRHGHTSQAGAFRALGRPRQLMTALAKKIVRIRAALGSYRTPAQPLMIGSFFSASAEPSSERVITAGSFELIT